MNGFTLTGLYQNLGQKTNKIRAEGSIGARGLPFHVASRVQ